MNEPRRARGRKKHGEGDRLHDAEGQQEGEGQAPQAAAKAEPAAPSLPVDQAQLA